MFNIFLVKCHSLQINYLIFKVEKSIDENSHHLQLENANDNREDKERERNKKKINKQFWNSWVLNEFEICEVKSCRNQKKNV